MNRFKDLVFPATESENSMRKVTIAEVAKRANYSKGTVSAVINSKNSVKPETRDHILKVMKELNFRPKGVARNLKKTSQDKSIGVIIKDLNYPFYASIATGAREYANSKGYSVIVASSESDHEREKELSHLFSTKDIKGAIIAPTVEGRAEIEHLFKLRMINYPFVLLEDVKGIQANVVAIDNTKAIKRAVTYLIDSGHTKIVHFAGPPNSSHTQERIEGFRHAFSESTLAFHKDMIVSVGSNYEESFARTLDYFKCRSRDTYPTAIVCFNDLQALAVLTALKELKLRVPEDISIIGNDDIYYAKIYPVPLTTIRAPQHEIGKKAAEILIENIESPTLLPPKRVVLDTEFIVRESTKVLKPELQFTK
ncbi:LacI family transcriptional regulator [candidate division KSB1 bacterium]|nr:MAG: LacI family transcriptional regulator [candidate division KSB1 bacterium]MBC6946360.1 LacI family transcriptional regulator [candidate division KSB1 bacterium]MCE7940713.1 LacI family transcriptional regulator [Chlorobi bacterium CHB1]MDL1874078.1 LacI family transcriptional regulator [Cytophagia bacterium CHB2]